MYNWPQVTCSSLTNHEAHWLEVSYYSYANGLELAPSDCEWIVPGSYVEE